jgi:hypothetical protein
MKAIEGMCSLFRTKLIVGTPRGFIRLLWGFLPGLRGLTASLLVVGKTNHPGPTHIK